MKKITLFIFLCFISVGYSQDRINGYYINIAGQRIEGYFKVSDYHNQDDLNFSASPDSKLEKLNPDTINEYGIADDYKFVKQTVLMDSSNIAGSNLSQNKEVNFVTVTVFLNVLMEGDATLYSYMDSGAAKYFYKIDSKQIETKQLIYKKYMATASATAENNQFRQQLYVDLQCGDTDELKKFLAIQYSKNNLVPLFEDYNRCKMSKFKTYDNNKGSKAKLYFSIFAGLYNSTYNVKSPRSKTEDESKLTYSVGLEGNYVFLKNFGIFARVEYEINSQWELTTPSYTYETSNNLNFSVGPRYFFNLTKKNKLYIDASMLISVVKGKVGIKIFQVGDGGVLLEEELNMPLRNALAFDFGAGYIFNDKFAAELRVNTNRNYLASSNVNIQSKHTRIGLNLKYTFN